jgi:threonylcarbamoyladenosine tRNA methylthiotransferase MtaB
MRRRYDVSAFEKAVRLAREVRDDLALSGDFMVGLPGESEADFRRTLDVTEHAGFMGLHVFRFSARPRTAAARYEARLDPAESRARSRRLIDLGHRLRRDYEARFKGRPLQVIWDRVIGDRIRGVSENYLQADAPALGRLPGQLEEIVWRAVSSAG